MLVSGVTVRIGMLVAVALLWAAPLTMKSITAQEFRIDTEVFVGEETEPIVESLTLFADGLVYDFLIGKQSETTVFDPHRGEFTLLDIDRQVRAVVKTQDVLDYTFQLEQYAAQDPNPIFAAAAQPNFAVTHETADEKGMKVSYLRLAGKPIEYSAVGTVPEQIESVRFYRNFADWYARLNSTRSGNLPPGSRMALNKALADHDLLPSEITRTITDGGRFSKKLVVRSTHLYNWKLSGEDRRQIAKVGDQMRDFRVVSFDDYRGAIAPAEATKSGASNNASRSTAPTMR